MLSTRLQTTFSLWQPLHLRVWRRIVDAAQAMGLVLLRARHEHRLRAHRRHVWSDLSDLSAHALKDIGAPDWVVLDATDRRDLARQRLDEFSTWRGV